jgi:hypothetical protein
MDASDGSSPSDSKLLGAWLNLQQAELMLQHLQIAGSHWPEAQIYLHSCITAMRSVTFTMQTALAHEPGFAPWYEGIRLDLAGDPEFRYLVEARNHVEKRGGLRLLQSHSVSYDGTLGISVGAIGPDGPDVRIPSPSEPESDVPVDWRKLDGFSYEVLLRFAPIESLPDPPDKEVKTLLREKIARLRQILEEAEELFGPDA